jgi:hypothetical protein
VLNILEFLQHLNPQTDTPGPGPEASVHMRTVMEALNGRAAFNERDALKLVEGPLKQLKAAPLDERVEFVFEAIDLIPRAGSIAQKLGVKALASNLLRSGLPLNTLDAVRLVERSAQRRQSFPYKAILAALDGLPMTPALRSALLKMRGAIDEWHGGREMKEIHERIDTLLKGAKETPVGPVSGWTGQVFREIENSPKQITWRRLFHHARTLTQSTASRKWQGEAAVLIEEIGRTEFLDCAHRWLALEPMPGMPQAQVPEEEADYQKGFVWALGALGDTAVAADIGDFACACFRKIPQIGAVSHRVGNACVNALAAMPGLDAVTQLSRLSMRVKYDVARRLIEKALMEAAERNGVGRDDLEAMSVPAFGLDGEGVRTETLGSCQARLAIENGAAVLTWSREGKPVKAPPAELKANHGDDLAALKKAAKELDTVLSARRLRLERQLLSESTCTFECWKAWYPDHPVTSTFAKRLIWEIESGGEVQTAVWWQDSLVDWAGTKLTPSLSAAVRLWHPIRSDVQTVLSWRCWFEDHDVRQPFKQAHREVYLLTDAERQTETYSNRFAAHIIRQHQFAALCRERGWQFNLMGNWDSANTPYLELPQYNLRAEYGVDFEDEGGGETSGHGIYLTIGTDRIQFFPIEPKPRRFEIRPRTPVRLVDVPALLFSEVMRDVDLFVGVTSIGSDPAWNAEQDEIQAEYWRRFADAELSTMAENRRTILESLVPKLAIGPRCRMEGRYLIVRGEWHEYRIHLGSGNVLMEPGSRYLCIVRGGGDTAAKVPLPFEGDAMLAVILSKAFLLANDKGIKDETILRQIR